MNFFDLNPERLYCDVYTCIITAGYVTNRTFPHPTSCSLVSIAGSRKELKKKERKKKESECRLYIEHSVRP